jgi:hypothetical protein
MLLVLAIIFAPKKIWTGILEGFKKIILPIIPHFQKLIIWLIKRAWVMIKHVVLLFVKLLLEIIKFLGQMAEFASERIP